MNRALRLPARRRLVAFAEAVYWHERAASAVIARQEELDKLAGWTGLIGNASIPAAPNAPTLAGLAQWGAEALRILGDHRDHLELRDAIERACDVADDLTERAERLAALVDDLVEETEFEFLFNRERQLFSIGFNVAEGRLDPSHYDTLASEARLASFVGIATGRIPHEHWFKLGQIAHANGDVPRPVVVERVDVRVLDARSSSCARIPIRSSTKPTKQSSTGK